jgi:hypothetical protein
MNKLILLALIALSGCATAPEELCRAYQSPDLIESCIRAGYAEREQRRAQSAANLETMAIGLQMMQQNQPQRPRQALVQPFGNGYIVREW